MLIYHQKLFLMLYQLTTPSDLPSVLLKAKNWKRIDLQRICNPVVRVIHFLSTRQVGFESFLCLEIKLPRHSLGRRTTVWFRSKSWPFLRYKMKKQLWRGKCAPAPIGSARKTGGRSWLPREAGDNLETIPIKLWIVKSFLKTFNSMETHICNLSIWESEAGELGYFWLCSKFRVAWIHETPPQKVYT